MGEPVLDELVQAYASLPEGERELEVRIYDGSAQMELSQENFRRLFTRLAPKKKHVEEISVTYSDRGVRFEEGLRPKAPPRGIRKERVKTINDGSGIKISLAREVPTDATPPRLVNFIRIRKRVSVEPKGFPGWRFDFTKVAQAKMSRPIPLANAVKETPADWKYEVEMEAVSVDPSDIVEGVNALRALVAEVVQMEPIMEVKRLLGRDFRSPRDIMNQVISLTLDDVHTITEGYAVTEKADGERMLLLLSPNGQVTEIRTTGAEPTDLTGPALTGGASLIDAEYLQQLGRYLLFDLLVNQGQNVTGLPFTERYVILKERFGNASWSASPKGSAEVLVKHFLFQGEDFESVFEASEKVYKKTKYDYYIDGLIYTPMHQPYMNRLTFKWKPPHDLTIDFLIMEPPGDNVVIGSNGIYKVVELYFLITFPTWRKHYMHNRELNELTAERFGLNPRHWPRNFPYPFAPGGDTKPFRAKVKVEEIKLTAYNDDLTRFGRAPAKKLYVASGVEPPMIPIMSGMVVEFAWEGGGWKPYRFRKDKTESYFEGLKEGEFRPGPNGWSATMSNWEIIQEPVTEALIFGKEPLPAKYYKKTRNVGESGKLAEVMYKFNNHVKRQLYQTYVPACARLIELAGGRGGDLDKALGRSVERILVTDIDAQALKEGERRYGTMRDKYRKGSVEFLQIDLNDPAQVKEHFPLGSSEQFQVVSCQFALHYFLGSLKSLKSICALVDRLTAPGGIFMFTGLDGKSVFDLLKKEPKMVFEKDGQVVASIERAYTDKRLKGYGQEVRVFIEKIGLEHPENLLNFEYVIKYFVDKLGFELVETQMFSTLLPDYNRVDQMSPAEQAYAGLNRYAVLRKPE